MQTHTIEIREIPEDLLKRLDQWAQERGRDRSQAVREIIEAKFQETPPERTFAEIVAPLQEDFEATGMTDEELGEFIDAEIKAHRAEQRAKAQPSHG